MLKGFTHILIVWILVQFGVSGCGSSSVDSFPNTNATRVNPINVNNKKVSRVDVQDSQMQIKDLKVENNDSCEQLLPGTPRGISCLYCMQPEAESQANKIVEILLQSCVKNVAISYLVDGSFGFNQKLLVDHIDKLSANTRTPFIIFYLSNGSSQRRWKNPPIQAFGTTSSPERFRSSILKDQATQEEFKAIIKRLLPVIIYAQEKRAQIFLIPMLEDNLDNNSFLNGMIPLVTSTIPNGINYTLGRNACPKCYPGNQSKIPAGLFSDLHIGQANFKQRDGLVSNDGVPFYFESDVNLAKELKFSIKDLAKVRDKALSQNNIFLLWNAEYQGVPGLINGETNFKNPKRRDYQIPTSKHVTELIKFLRLY